MNENESQNLNEEVLEFPAQEPQEILAAPQQSPKDRKEERKKNRKEKANSTPVRRVGTFTMGIALIITGVTIAMSFAFPSFNFLSVMKLAPLVLVALGVEVLWANARKGEARLKYDFLSAFICFVLICGSACAALIPTVWKYYGPDRYEQELRLSTELEKQLFEQIPAGLVNQCNVYIDLGMAGEATIEEATKSSRTQVNMTLNGPFENKEAFAKICAQILPIMRETGINHVAFNSDNDQDRWELYVDGLFQFNATEEQLAEDTMHYVRYTDEYQNTEWLTPEDAAQHKEMEANNQAQMEQQLENLWQGYERGYEDGMNGQDMKSQEELKQMYALG